MVKKSSEFVPCKSYQVRNPNNRCVGTKPKNSPTKESKTKPLKSPTAKVTKVSETKVSKPKVSETKVSKPKIASKSPKKEKVFKDCGVGKIRSPTSNRCIDEERYKKQIAKSSSPAVRKSRSQKSSIQKSSKSPKVEKNRNGIKFVNKKSTKESKAVTKVTKTTKSPKENQPNLKDDYDFIEARFPAKWKEPKTLPSCITRSQKKLKDLQVKVALYMQKHDSLLVVHGTGCGKTLTAITVSQCYLDDKPENKVVFLGPASLTSNFKKEMTAYGVDNFDKYEFYSFDKFYRQLKDDNPVDCRNALLIIDEAHNLKNPTSGRSKSAVLAAYQADKRLLLTATPFISSLLNFVPLINMLYGKNIISTTGKDAETSIGKDLTEVNLAKLNYYLYDKVHYVDCKNPNDFPKKIEHREIIPMTNEYYLRYIEAIQTRDHDIFEGNPEPFYNGERRAVNRLGEEYFSQKMEKIINIIKDKKSILYSNWLEFGAKPIEKVLKKNEIKYRIFSGETPKGERQKIVDAFNNNEFTALICTKAAGEGIDLKEVRNVVILEPPWDQAALDQITGRAIRYQSHSKLPLADRKVDIYYLRLGLPTNLLNNKDYEGVKTGDEILYDIIDKKKQAMETVINSIKKISI